MTHGALGTRRPAEPQHPRVRPRRPPSAAPGWDFHRLQDRPSLPPSARQRREGEGKPGEKGDGWAGGRERAPREDGRWRLPKSIHPRERGPGPNRGSQGLLASPTAPRSPDFKQIQGDDLNATTHQEIWTRWEECAPPPPPAQPLPLPLPGRRQLRRLQMKCIKKTPKIKKICI